MVSQLDRDLLLNGMISAAQIKELRERTGISMSQCKQALETAGGDLVKAVEVLRSQGAAVAEKKAGRNLGAGRIGSYFHTTGTIGVMVEVACETDFVAKTGDFQKLADDLAMHIAGFNPVDLTELLTQPHLKDSTRTITQVVNEAIQKLGERIEIVRFARFQVGQV